MIMMTGRYFAAYPWWHGDILFVFPLLIYFFLSKNIFILRWSVRRLVGWLVDFDVDVNFRIGTYNAPTTTTFEDFNLQKEKKERFKDENTGKNWRKKREWNKIKKEDFFPLFFLWPKLRSTKKETMIIKSHAKIKETFDDFSSRDFFPLLLSSIKNFELQICPCGFSSERKTCKNEIEWIQRKGVKMIIIVRLSPVWL